jgi:hypothetical protein
MEPTASLTETPGVLADEVIDHYLQQSGVSIWGPTRSDPQDESSRQVMVQWFLNEVDKINEFYYKNYTTEGEKQ